MKQGKIVAAHKALLNLNEQRLSLTSAYAVYKLLKETQKAWDFQVEQEEKIFTKLKPKMEKKNNWKFATPDDAKSFADFMKELAEMESDIEIKPITIRLSEEISVTPSDINALDGFVTFEE